MYRPSTWKARERPLLLPLRGLCPFAAAWGTGILRANWVSTSLTSKLSLWRKTMLSGWRGEGRQMQCHLKWAGPQLPPSP